MFYVVSRTNERIGNRLWVCLDKVEILGMRILMAFPPCENSKTEMEIQNTDIFYRIINLLYSIERYIGEATSCAGSQLTEATMDNG